jgi:hypothetical protein
MRAGINSDVETHSATAAPQLSPRLACPATCSRRLPRPCASAPNPSHPSDQAPFPNSLPDPGLVSSPSVHVRRTPRVAPGGRANKSHRELRLPSSWPFSLLPMTYHSHGKYTEDRAGSKLPAAWREQLALVIEARRVGVCGWGEWRTHGQAGPPATAPSIAAHSCIHGLQREWVMFNR